MSALSFQAFARLETGEAVRLFGEAMISAGYFAFYRFAEEFRQGLKLSSDAEFALFRSALDRAALLFPFPEQFSPALQSLWDEFSLILAAKTEVYAAVSAAKRDGEWQVLIDNPHVHHQVVCYTGLDFSEAAYLYGYFRRELKPHENLRLQRIDQLLSVKGDPRLSILPAE